MYNHSISGYQCKQLSSVHVHLMDSADLSIDDQWSSSLIADCGTRINTSRTINPIAYKHFIRRRYPMLARRRRYFSFFNMDLTDNHPVFVVCLHYHFHTRNFFHILTELYMSQSILK